MWCVTCLAEIVDADKHAECKEYMWRAMSEEYTKAKLRMMKQTCDVPGNQVTSN